jgi:hypothetical protein
MPADSNAPGYANSLILLLNLKNNQVIRKRKTDN